jgi:hypothetical protein
MAKAAQLSRFGRAEGCFFLRCSGSQRVKHGNENQRLQNTRKDEGKLIVPITYRDPLRYV